MPAKVTGIKIVSGIVSTDPNAYFNSLVSRPDHWKSYSLRNQAQLLQYKNSSAAASVNYIYPNDSNPHKQDAAKVVIPPFTDGVFYSLAAAVGAADTTLQFSGWHSNFIVGRGILLDNEAMRILTIDSTNKRVTVARGYAGTIATPHAAGVGIHIGINSLQNQVRLPIGTADNNVYLFTWDTYWTDSYLKTGLTNHKAFQFSNTSDAIWLEEQARYGGAYSTGFNAATDVASITFRSYSTAIAPVTTVDPLQPKAGQLIVKPNRWTRQWVQIEPRSDTADRMSVWVADEVTSPVLVYDNLPLTGWGIGKFWLEFNTSEDKYVRGDTRDLVAYVRNLAVLKNPTIFPMPRPI